MATETHSFLGANTPNGFVSLFGELYDPYRDHNVHIIKGGPGCGKSTLMKRIAERARAHGLDAECVHCSSDPDSLDAVLVPALRLFVCDGTAPPTVCWTVFFRRRCQKTADPAEKGRIFLCGCS